MFRYTSTSFGLRLVTLKKECIVHEKLTLWQSVYKKLLNNHSNSY